MSSEEGGEANVRKLVIKRGPDGFYPLPGVPEVGEIIQMEISTHSAPWKVTKRNWTFDTGLNAGGVELELIAIPRKFYVG